MLDVIVQQESHVSITCDENTARPVSQPLVLNALDPLYRDVTYPTGVISQNCSG